MRRERREREGEIQEREREGVRTGEREGENRKEREREIQEKGAVAPPSSRSRTGGFSPLAGTAAGRRRSAGGAVALGWPSATPQGS